MKYNLEILRLLAVVAITFIHTRHQFVDARFAFYITEIPRLGTLVLSIISGYLFYITSQNKTTIIRSKVKSLLIPFFIANVIVLACVEIAYHGLHTNYLNRFAYDYRLLTDGIFALNHSPIDPPTYYVRDIFVVFMLLELFWFRNWKMLFFLIPLYVFGRLLIRYDIGLFFLVGILVARCESFLLKYKWIVVALLVCLSVIGFVINIDYAKFFISPLAFLLCMDMKVRFWNIGSYTYLLHLYHSPIIVFSYPIIAHFVYNEYGNIFMQVGCAWAGAYLLFVLTRKIPFLKVMSGGR